MTSFNVAIGQHIKLLEWYKKEVTKVKILKCLSV